MTEFIAALAVFVLAHSLPNATGMRAALISRFGRKTYIIFYSMLSIALLAWLITAALRAPYYDLWQPGMMTAIVPLIAMLLSSILLTSAALRPNPLSIAFVTKPLVTGEGILALLRHPLLWALFLWAASHAIANGDLVSLILFGGLALFALSGMTVMQRRARRTMPNEAYDKAMAQTCGPVKGQIMRAFGKTMLIEIATGVLLYIILLHSHEPVIGVDPLALVIP